MLSLSAELTNTSVDLQMINGATGDQSSELAHAAELMRFAESLASRDSVALDECRQQLLAAAGAEVLVDAAAVAGNFQRMVRIADSAGIPLDERNMIATVDIRKQLDLHRFESAANSRATTLADRIKGRMMKPLVKMVIRAVDRKARSEGQ